MLIACGNCHNWVVQDELASTSTLAKSLLSQAGATPAQTTRRRRRGACHGAMPGVSHDPNDNNRTAHWPITTEIDGCAGGDPIDPNLPFQAVARG